MSLPVRLFLIAAFLGVTLSVQLGLTWHMRGGEELDYTYLRRPISELPLIFDARPDKANPANNGAWIGKVNPNEAAIRQQLPFTPDDLVSRVYFKNDGSYLLNLYMVHSRQSDDRKHHPEVCIRDVTGATEDLASRTILFVDGEKKQRPIQRFRFRTDPTQYTTVYYWHYTFPRVPRAGETELQVLYQRMNKPAPSITVQVSLTAEKEHLEPVETGFLVFLDQALRDHHLPEGAVMACDRIPIALQTRE